MMATSQVIGGVSGKDPTNFLMQVMYKKYLLAQAEAVDEIDSQKKE